jgi:hypothetical protein
MSAQGGSPGQDGGEVERLARRRRRILAASAIGFLSWQGSLVASSTSLAGPRLVDLVRVAGFALWAVSLVAMLATGRRAAMQPGVQSALEDELTQANRRGAFQFGYWAMLIGAAALYAVAIFTPLSVSRTMPLLLAVGVTVPALRFVMLDRRGEPRD